MGKRPRGPLSPDQRKRLARFAIQSLIVTTLAMVVVGFGLVSWTQQYVTEDYARFIGGNIRDIVGMVMPLHADPATASPEQLARLDQTIAGRIEQGAVVALRLTNEDGLIVYSTDPDEIGSTVPMSDEWREAFNGEPKATVFRESASDWDIDQAVLPVVQVCASFSKGKMGEPHGVIQVVRPYTSLDQRLTGPVPVVWSAVVGAALFVWLGVVLLTWRAERRIAGAHLEIEALRDRIGTALRDSEADSIGTVNALNAAVDAKDSYTAGHCLKVAHNAHLAGQRLGLADDELETLERASLLHDIGKIGIPEGILLKPAGLTSEEYEIVKQHSEVGARIVASIPSLAELAPLVRAHHERWDGRGYPDGTAGHDIPIVARILATADALDAMMSARPYRGRISREHARTELDRNAGTQFDPQVVDVFVELLDERLV